MPLSTASPPSSRSRRSQKAVSAVLLLGVAVCAGPARAQQPATEQRRLELISGLPHEQQLATPQQSFLQAYVRRGALLYLHRLDGLGCRDLFSLGDEVLFAGAFGNGDGSDHNLVFLEGSGAPSHVDGGPYRLPADTFRTYWPPTSGQNTFWHECNHALLDTAGLGIAEAPYADSLDSPEEGRGLGARTALTSSDSHHPFIEGVGQRNAEAYEELIGFEAAVRRADLAESEYLSEGRDIDYAVERQLWGEAHQRFSAFLKKMKRVANMPAEALAAYRQATGVFFSTAEQVAEHYRAGGMKRSEHGEALPIKPPAWIFFADRLLMPVQLELRDSEGRDLEQPGVASSAKHEIKDGIFRQQIEVGLRARGSFARLTRNAAQNRAVGGAVARGTLRIRLVEDDPLVTLSVAQGVGGRAVAGLAGPGGPSLQLFELDLKEADSQPIRVVFARRKLSELREPTTWHVELAFSDPGQERLYDSSTAQVSFTLGPSADAAAGPGKPAAEPAGSAQPTATGEARTSGQPAQGERLDATISWGPLPTGFSATSGFLHDDRAGPQTPLPSKGERELVSGPVMFFDRGKWGTDGIVAELYTRRYEKPPTSLAEHVDRFSPTAGPYAALFRHSEVVVGGRKGYLSQMRARSGTKINWVYDIEVDPRQGIWAQILSDLDVGEKNAEAAPILERQHAELIASLRFGPEPSALAIELPQPKPLPKAFQDAPIDAGELLPRPPPPDSGIERSDRRKARATRHAAPGGYSLTLPGSWKRGARAAGAQLFDSADRRFVLACPDSLLAPPSDFAGFRDQLAAQWRSRAPSAQIEARECGGLSLLLVRPEERESLWHLYVGSGLRAVELRVLGIAGAARFPDELFEVACGTRGLSP